MRRLFTNTHMEETTNAKEEEIGDHCCLYNIGGPQALEPLLKYSAVYVINCLMKHFWKNNYLTRLKGIVSWDFDSLLMILSYSLDVHIPFF
jgi:hypothetical protein